MNNSIKLAKGEQTEEFLRYYYLSLGFFVIRGVNFVYDSTDITDVDLLLYNKSSILTRERINVDIKSKDSPKAYERILAANGLMSLLKLDSCIIATTDSRSSLTNFGQLYNTRILNGNFLNSIKNDDNIKKLMDEHISEEELLQDLSQYKFFGKKTWKDTYLTSKSLLLTDLNFSTINLLLIEIKDYLTVVMTDINKRESAVRLIYILCSFLLITIDYISRDWFFLNEKERERKFIDGFTYGSLGKDGFNKIINIAVKLSGNKKSANEVKEILTDPDSIIFSEFLAFNNNLKLLFDLAKQLHLAGFKKHFISPMDLEPELKSIIVLLLDIHEINRRKFLLIFDS